MIDASLQHDHLIFIYFVPTALIAIRYGSVPAMCVTIASTFAAAYFFYAPRFSFKVESPLDLFELTLFSLLGIDPNGHYPTASGRSVAIVKDGSLVRELVA